MPNTLAENLQRLKTAKTAIGNAITTKGGTVGANDGFEEFVADIATIPSGGGSSSNDVNFYDYDGTIVQSYSADDFANLSELPTNPTHEGLTAQGWNWSLTNAKAYVASYGKLNIGQLYTTSDGKTRIYINLPEGKISPILMLYLNDNSELDIDWGDGSTHSTWTTTSATYKDERHSYPNKGEYVIAITVVSGSFVLQSQSTSYNTFFTDGKNGNISSDRVYLNSIQKIEIGTGITSIENNAFFYCSSLSSITIPSSVTTIGSGAFNSCYSLSSATIPDGVTMIGQYAFQNCYSLSSITIPDDVTTIQSYAFYSCYSLSSVTIPDGVTSIDNYAFQACSSLSSITIPDTVTSIGTYAFSGCHSLSSITIPDGVTSIGGYVFNGCYSLSSITIPNTVTSIETYAFYNCYSLSSITIPNTVTTIGTYAFYSCYSLSSVTIPSSVTSIGTYAFYNCYSLSSVTIPDGVTTIGGYAFNDCYSLSSVTIPSSVTSIGPYAFYKCSSLSSITIPSSVTTIKSYAFNGCSSMDYIKFIPTTPPTIQNSNAWSNVSTSTILYVPALVSNLYMNRTNYPAKATYTYLGYATYESGTTLPTTTTDETYTLTWYATSADAIAQTNPITQGTGNEVYSRATPVV